jgi:iron complex outermembrane receptor protein
MWPTTKLNGALALAFGAMGLAGVPMQVQAQSQSLDRVEITGSSIKRIDSESALPVQTVTKAEIARSGAQTVAELIQNLPAVQGFTQVTESVGGGGGGFSGASLHGVGDARTLVLLNGRRVATWAGQTLTGAGAAIDLNSIPLAAVDRVELLTDGASALYGTDAIAGVINFILKRDMTTGEASLLHSVPKGGVGKNTVLSVTKGFGDLSADGFNALMALSVEKQSAMRASDRSYSRTGVIPFSKDGQRYVFFNGSFRAAPANYNIYDPGSGYDVYGNPYLSANGRCPANHILDSGVCLYDYASQVDLIPETRRDAFFGSVATKLDGGHTLTADLALNRFRLTSRMAQPPVDITIPTGSALYNKYMTGSGALDPAAPAGSELYAYWRGVDAGARTTEDTTNAGHLALSLTGTLAEWDYTTAVTHSTNRWVERHLGGWLLQNEQDAAIASGSFDPFLMPGQQSAAGSAAIAGMQHIGTFKTQTSTLDALELRGSRELFKLGGGAAQLGTGVDLRRERVKYEPSDVARGAGNNIAGDSSQEQPYDVSRSIWGAYAELLLPVTKALEFTGALRHDHYSDFGSTDNFKLAARFQPSKEFLVRGSWGTGFRAPSVPQVAAGRQLYGVTASGYSCPTTALATLQASDPATVCRPDKLQYDVIASGNRDLKPEKSNQWSLGLRAEPEKWLSAGVDFWSVYVKDRISQLTEDVVAADPDKYLKNYTTFVDPGTGRHYLAFYLPNENLGDERYLGADFDAKVGFNTPVGKSTLTLQWMHLYRYDYQRTKGGEWYSNLNRFNDTKVTFRNQLRLSGNLVSGKLENTLTVNYRPGYQDQAYTAADSYVYSVNADGSVGAAVDMTDRRVGSYTTVDWQMKYEASKLMNVTLGVINLFDRDPPQSIKSMGGHQLGYDNRYADARGRTLYGRLTVKF